MDAERVRFDAFELDLKTGDLKKDGRAVKLARQPSQLLALIVRNAGSIVPREQIQRALWPDGTIVDYDQSINFCVKRIRDALGDEPSGPRYVETVPRKGYRFLGDVRPVVDSRSPWWMRPTVGLGIAALILGVWRPWDGSRSSGGVDRFVIPLEAPGPGIPFDLSPDGKTIVYSSRPEGNRLLHKRPVNGFESVAINGAEGWAPFFSHDGAWIGFLTNGDDLRKARVDGGPSILVSDSVTFGARGASWGSDGTIVINGGVVGPLYRVPASGGDAEPFTRIDVERGDLGHLWPQFLPGGDWVLFTVMERLGYDNVIAAQSLRSGEWREILRGGTSARYVTTGHLVYAHSETLFAVRFDPKTLTVSGEPVPVLSGIATQAIDGRALFRVASNGTLAYVPAAREPRQWLAWYHRDGTDEPLDLPVLDARLGPGVPLITPRLSPDGTKLAVSIPGPNQQAVLWLYDLDRNTEVQFSNETSTGPLEWSPSGESIAYLAMDRGGYEIIVRSLDREEDAKAVYRGSTVVWPVSWLPVDAGILFPEIHRESTGIDIMLVEPVENATPRPLLQSPTHEFNAKVSPNGRWIAYTMGYPNRNVYVSTFPELERTTLVSPGGGLEPLWSRDGKELFFKTTDLQRLLVVKVDEADEPIVSEPRVLLSGIFGRNRDRPVVTYYDISPDGERFLMVVEEDLPETTPQIHIVLDWLDELERKMAANGR